MICRIFVGKGACRGHIYSFARRARYACVLCLPDTHWRILRTNNPMERLMRKIRRRTRVLGVFPDRQSALMLLAARPQQIATPRCGTRRYLAMEALTQPLTDEVTDP